MAVKHLVGVIFVLGCLAWRCSASHDEGKFLDFKITLSNSTFN